MLQRKEDGSMLIEVKIPEKLPFLESLCWQREGIKNLTPLEMLKRYERGWYYRGVLDEISPPEAGFIQQLANLYNSWLAETMFTQDFHNKILLVLSQINRNFFEDCGTYFGGGTLVSLIYGEYRLSKDIDFVCATGKGYRLLRQEIFNQGYNAIFSSQNDIRLPGEIQANQYGIRFPVFVGETLIKFEIIMEGRIELGNPEYPIFLPIPCLNKIDCFAEKLLANADRWWDHSVESRDLIDLAIQRLNSAIPQEAIAKAENAYAVMAPLKKAIIYFQENPDYREKCFTALRISDLSKIIDGIDLLAADFELDKTIRIFTEIKDDYLDI
jgi:Nucleotidyl transferase AbiEii toxin, Type IV TA system